MDELRPNCKSSNTINWCKRKTENSGLIQRYKCLECSHRFIQDDGFFRMRNSPQKISQSIDLFIEEFQQEKSKSI